MFSITKFTYMVGGPGLVLTRESVRRLVTKAFVEHPNWMCGPGLYSLSFELFIGLSKITECEKKNSRNF